MREGIVQGVEGGETVVMAEVVSAVCFRKR